MDYLNFINSSDGVNLRNLIQNSLIGPVSFKDVRSLPKEKGVYFIYENGTLVYIGQGKKVRSRCMQYLQKGTGRTFRNKLMRDKGIKNVDVAIKYIENNCTIRYIIDNKHKKMEHLAIGLFNPKYND